MLGLSLRPRAAVAGWWDDMKLGSVVEVTYMNDDIPHERVLLWPVREGGEWIVLSPDGDEWLEALAARDPKTGPSGGGPLPVDGSPPTDGHALYRFREYPTDAIFRTMLERGCKLARSELKKEETLIVPTVVVNPNGEEEDLDTFYGKIFPLPLGRRLKAKAVRPPTKGLEGPAGPKSSPPPQPSSVVKIIDFEAPDGQIWLAAETCAGFALGEEVTLDPTRDEVAGGRFALSKRGGEWVEVRAHRDGLRSWLRRSQDRGDPPCVCLWRGA